MELGATICLPRQPQCLLCPVSDLCKTRGELRRPKNRTRPIKREIHYALACRDGAIFLAKRPKTAALMPGMWELPETGANGASSAWLTLRHSITVTNYVVRVMQSLPPAGVDGRWVQKPQLTALPLTGLTRKILQAAKII
jgi:A/G-specific adenine glycosylase